MKRNRSVIITGAGAVIPWNANTTTELTEILKSDTCFVNDKEERIGQYLFDLLSSKTPNRNSPNIETILNFIEELYQFKDNNNKPLVDSQSLKSSFRIYDYFQINSEINNKLHSFEIGNPNIKDGFLNLKLLKTIFGLERKIHGSLFYGELYLYFIYLIIEQIKTYDNETNLNKCHKINEIYFRFLMGLKQNRGLIRYYTLNYDLLPLKIYDGFFNGYDNIGKIDVESIVKSKYTDVYYNMHGSTNASFNKIKAGYIHGFKTATTFENNFLIQSPIIAGYNKLNRLFGESHFHFYNSLIGDCYNADVIYLIGYSFGDIHINSAVNGAMQIGKTKIIVIDLIDIADNKSRRIFENNYKKTNPTNEYSIKGIEPNNPNKLQLHLNGFKEYLESN